MCHRYAACACRGITEATGPYPAQASCVSFGLSNQGTVACRTSGSSSRAVAPNPKSALAIGGTWLAFILAVCFALPQPPNPLHVAIGSAAGALLVVFGFSAAARCRTVPVHSANQRTKLAALAASAGAALGFVLLMALVSLANHEPALRARFAGRLNEPTWRPWALGLESSILEEVAFRLFAMSVVAWLVRTGRLIPGCTDRLAPAAESQVVGG
jgi:hypothetical protein